MFSVLSDQTYELIQAYEDASLRPQHRILIEQWWNIASIVSKDLRIFLYSAVVLW